MADELDITGQQASRSFYATAKANNARIYSYADEHGRGRCFRANGYLYMLRHVDGKLTLTVREDTEE